MTTSGLPAAWAQSGLQLRVDPLLLGLPKASAAVPATPPTAAKPVAAPLPPAASASAAPTDAKPTAPTTTAPASATAIQLQPSTTLSVREEIRAEAQVIARQADKTDLGPDDLLLIADRITGLTDREAHAEGRVELYKGEQMVLAESITYWPLDDELEAEGNVRLLQGESVVRGPHLKMQVDARIGTFDAPSYFLKREPSPLRSPAGAPPLSHVYNVIKPPKRVATEAHGAAERLDFEGENRLRIFNGSYTTCKPGEEDWYTRAEEMALDYDREEGEGYHAKVYFKDVPILYLPWMSFSLNDQRKSGFLSPSFGTSSKSGIEFTTPYYWNIAPNMDATLAPRVLSKRGLQLNTEFRHISHYSQSQARIEALPNDAVYNDNRYGFSLLHNQVLGGGFSGNLNLNGASDNRYFSDLSSRVSVTSQTQLLRHGALNYDAGWWNASLIGQSFQTLQPDTGTPIDRPYAFAPRLVFNARKLDFHQADAWMMGEYTQFTHGSKVEGQRAVAYPQLALPWINPGYYVTPKIGVHATHYNLSRQALGTPDSLSRTVPIFSVDSGMTFERETRWLGQGMTQTLEPRLYYLNVPYRDQRQIPLFDTGLADFNFAQIFSENPFVGQDRIGDANQITAAVTSRLIDPSSGSELLRAMVGQRFYLRDQQVALPGQRLRRWGESDFLAAVSGQVLPRLFADAAWQYDSQQGRVERFSLGGRYHPSAGQTFNAAYRFNRDTLEQVDISGQWPIFAGWNAVGRYNYSLHDRRPIETIGGLEYFAGCWALRVVGQRLATSTGSANTALFFQLELSDFSRIGSSPLDLLKRNIHGYGQVSQSVADPIFGQ